MTSERRVGMSIRGFTGPSLHQVVNGASSMNQRHNGTRSSLKKPPKADKAESKFRITLAEEDIKAAPVSDDEDDGPVNYGSADSDMEGAQSADIQPRFLAKNKVVSSQNEKFTYTTKGRAEPISSPATRTRWSKTNVTESQSKNAEIETSKSSSQEDGPLFGGISTSRRIKCTYGKSTKSSATGSQPKAESSPEPKFKKHGIGILNSQNSPQKKFKSTTLDSGLAKTPESKAPKFLKHDVAGLSPTPSPAKKFNANTHLNDLLNSQHNISLFSLADVTNSSKTNALKSADSPLESPTNPSQDIEEIQSQVPVFKIPQALQEEIVGAGFSLAYDLSQPRVDNEAVEMEQSVTETATPLLIPSLQAKCPMCGTAVEADFLRNYSNGKYMNIRTQANFCRAHKKKSAQDDWVTKGYPSIDWTILDTRLAAHHAFLQSLLDGAPSHSRAVLEEEVRSGKDRTLAQAVMKSDMTLTPGYYGTRGLRAMSEYIMHAFSPQLRRTAIEDRFVAARGVTGYVQMVLVPELAVRLIAEDMGVGENAARRIMKESVGFGDLLNEEVEDVVVLREGDAYEY